MADYTRRQNLKYLTQRKRRLQTRGAKSSEIKEFFGTNKPFNQMNDNQLNTLANQLRETGQTRVQENGNILLTQYNKKAKAYYGSSYDKDFMPSLRTQKNSAINKMTIKEAQARKQERISTAKQNYLEQLDKLADKANIKPSTQVVNKIKAMRESQFKDLLNGKFGTLVSFDGLYMYMTSDRWNVQSEQISADEMRSWYNKICEVIASH